MKKMKSATKVFIGIMTVAALLVIIYFITLPMEDKSLSKGTYRYLGVSVKVTDGELLGLYDGIGGGYDEDKAGINMLFEYQNAQYYNELLKGITLKLKSENSFEYTNGGYASAGVYMKNGENYIFNENGGGGVFEEGAIVSAEGKRITVVIEKAGYTLLFMLTR